MKRTEFSYWNASSPAALREQIAELGLELPVADSAQRLTRPVTLGARTLKNAMAVHPMEGADGTPEGAPGELTFRRYERYAAGGAGLIWLEAVAVSPDARSSPNQLTLTEDTLDGFCRLRERIARIDSRTVTVLQLTHSGRFCMKPVPVRRSPLLDERFGIGPDDPLVSDGELERIADSFVRAARLARRAGFDGVDVKTCHQYLLSELLSAYERPGKYGGSFENRASLILRICRETARELGPEGILATRICAYDHMPYPYGFGTASPTDASFCPDEGVRLLREMAGCGLSLVSSSVGTDVLEPGINRPCNYPLGAPEHPLVTLERLVGVTAALKKALPELSFLSAGFSYLHQLAPFAAAGVLERGMADLAGFGRLAIANPNFANDIASETLTAKNCCVACGKCGVILGSGRPTGCPVRDPATYLPVLREAEKEAKA